MSLTYTIQGFDLHQPEIGFKLLQSTSFAPPVNPRRAVVEIPGMHGELPLWEDELSAQKLTLKVRIQDRDPAGLQAKWEHLRALMWTGSRTGLTVRRVMGEQVTSCFAQLEAMDEPEFWSAAGMVDTVILLNIPYGRWEDIHTEETAVSTLSSTVTLPFVAESTAPVTRALFRFGGPYNTDGAWNDVYDDTTQTGFRVEPGRTLSGGMYVLVDTEAQRAWINNTDDWNARQEDISYGLRPLNGGMLTMVSVPGFQLNNRTTALRTVRSTGASSTTLTVQGRRTYL